MCFGSIMFRNQRERYNLSNIPPIDYFWRIDFLKIFIDLSLFLHIKIDEIRNFHFENLKTLLNNLNYLLYRNYFSMKIIIAFKSTSVSPSSPTVLSLVPHNHNYFGVLNLHLTPSLTSFACTRSVRPYTHNYIIYGSFTSVNVIFIYNNCAENIEKRSEIKCTIT